MIYGSGEYTYQVVEGWGQLPDGWTWGWIPGVACDSQDRVFVYSRSEHPLILFDREGNFLETWGDELLEDAHGIYIDSQDNVYCTERNTHCVHKFNALGEHVMTLGTPGLPSAEDGLPFRLPTDLVVASNGDLYISDGYENARVHRYSADGEWLHSWGEWGDGPGQFGLSHCIRIDAEERLWVCDRSNNRIQIFDLDGNYLDQWTGLRQPDTIFFDPSGEVVYIAELEQQVSIYTLDGTLLSRWGRGESSQQSGEFIACPHGIWADSHGDLYVGEVQTDGHLQKFTRC